MSIDLAAIAKQVHHFLHWSIERERDVPPRLREAMAYSILTPGKRLRPALVPLACEAAGGYGNAAMPAPIFYSYAYPEAPGFAEAKIQPDAAVYQPKLREFILPYDTVRTAEKPDELLLDFAQSAYDAASELGKWDRKALEEVKPSLHFTHLRP